MINYPLKKCARKCGHVRSCIHYPYSQTYIIYLKKIKLLLKINRLFPIINQSIKFLSHNSCKTPEVRVGVNGQLEGCNRNL